MAPYLKSMMVAINDKLIREYLTAIPIKIELPITVFNWGKFIEEAKTCFGCNFFPFLMFLAGSVSVFHYHEVLKILGKILFWAFKFRTIQNTKHSSEQQHLYTSMVL